MKILAIDIGSAHIKSVIVESKFKRFDIILHDITSVPDAWEPAQPSEQLLSPGQLATLAEVRSRYATGVDRIVTNLPFSLYSSRFQTFPFKDKRKVASAVKFAIEDEIPFDLEECVVSSHLFPTKTKETSVITAFAPLPPLEKFIESLNSIQLSPDCLMADDAALGAQFVRAKQDSYQNIAVLNLGHRKTGMFFFRDNLPVLHRNTMLGGFDITRTISERYKLPVAEAELVKTERGFLALPNMQLTADQQAFSDTIRSTLEPVFSDFQQSMMAFASRYNDNIQAVYVCGGTSLLPGLPEYLEHRWKKKVIPLQVTHLFPQATIRPQKGLEWLLPTATALGLSQASGDARSYLNLRSGKLYAGGRGLKLDFKQFVYPAKLALTIYSVAMLSVILQTFFLQRQRDAKDIQLNRALKTVLGSVSASYLDGLKATPERLKKTLDSKLAEAVKGGGGSGSAALELLADLTRDLPKGAAMEVKQFDLAGGKLTIKVESPTADDANRAVSALQLLPEFQSPKASPLEAAKGNAKRFTITATVNSKKGG
jgi:Tfp pilus assembly PilM family ATPase